MSLQNITNKLANLPELIIDGEIIPVGKPHMIRINAGKLPSDNKINVVAHIYHSGKPGPSVLIMAGVHGNEINGIEIVRRTIMEREVFQISRGTVIIIPLLNVYGFINFTRDVAEGKDLNRSFPGHAQGSLASRVARIISKKILPHVDIAIDLHTGGEARYNYPQMRYSRRDLVAAALAKESGLKYAIESTAIAHSFRKVAHDMGIPAIVFEGGESIRIDGLSIDQGVLSIKNILAKLNMLPFHTWQAVGEQYIIKKDTWVRASQPGMFLWHKSSGAIVKAGEVIGEINDPYGTKSIPVVTPYEGHIIGHNNASVVTLGDALFHIGTIAETMTQTLALEENFDDSDVEAKYHLTVTAVEDAEIEEETDED
jgi:uncharacterized protein